MADFTELLQDVYAITNRPDLVTETVLAVKYATLQLHRAEHFYKDLTEVALQFDASNYLQAIDYRLLFPRYRDLKYLRKYDPNSTGGFSLSGYGANGVGPFLEILDPSNVLDSYNSQLADVAYVAGDLIQLKSSTAIRYCLIGIYQSPDVSSPEKYKSWIAVESPDAIVFAAAAYVFGTVLGNKAKQDANTFLAQSAFLTVKNSNIVATGD